MTMDRPASSGACLWLAWVAVNALFLAAGQAAFGILDETVAEQGEVGDAIAHLVGYLAGFAIADGGADTVLGFALMGVATGLVQWLVFHRQYDGSGWWAAASGVGFSVGGVLAVGAAVAGLGDALGAAPLLT
jgi:hypothetical protein